MSQRTIFFSGTATCSFWTSGILKYPWIEVAGYWIGRNFIVVFPGLPGKANLLLLRRVKQDRAIVAVLNFMAPKPRQLAHLTHLAKIPVKTANRAKLKAIRAKWQ